MAPVFSGVLSSVQRVSQLHRLAAGAAGQRMATWRPLSVEEIARICAAALRLHSVPGAVVLCAGTDGTDGPTDAAGAFAFTSTLARAEAAGLRAGAALLNNDSYHFFDALGDLLKTGPTNTNVMDVRIILLA